MKKVFLIHGFEGTPNGGWRPYLMSELAKDEICVFSLLMPNPNQPKQSAWLKELHKYIKKNIEDEIVLVGHSLGGTTILRYLEKHNPKNIIGSVIVSASCRLNKNKKISGFLDKKFEWLKIKERAGKIFVIHGDDDSLVPLVEGEEISSNLGGELIVIPNGKHLNGSAGFITLPEALNAIKKIIN